MRWLAGVSAAVLLTVGVVGASGGAARAEVPAGPEPLIPDAAQVLSDAAGDAEVTVGITTRTDSGTLQVHDVTVSGAEEAVAVIKTAATDPRTVAADVSAPVVALDSHLDPLRPEQFSMDRLCIDQRAAQVRVQCGGRWAENYAHGDGVVVAVLDSGIWTEHPDLAGAFVPGATCVGVPECQGRASTPAVDVHHHGTEVTGILAARALNSQGVAGMAVGASIMPVQVLPVIGDGDALDLARGITWAVDHGARVLNISAGTVEDNLNVRAAIADAVARDVVVVAAAGNFVPDGQTLMPAGYPGVVGVGATTADDAAWLGTPIAPEVDVVAPGERIMSTCASVQVAYCQATGTSMASPQVAAVAAQIRQRFPSMNAADVEARLELTAQDLGPPGRDDRFGHGLVNPVAALAAPGPASVVGSRAGYGSADVDLAIDAVGAEQATAAEYSVDGGKAWRPAAGAAPTTTATATGLPNGVTTPLLVRLRNGAGAGPPSQPVEVTPLGAGFVPVTPQRIYDSRAADGPMTSGQVRHLDTAVSGRPAGAVAVAYNVTVTETDGGGFLAVAPGDAATPPPVSTINWDAPGTNVANATTVGLGPDGGIQVFDGVGRAHVIVDVLGFYVPESAEPLAALFVPLDPVRAFDSRTSGGPLASGQQRIVPVSQVGVPAEATALSYNVTVVNTRQAGFVSVTPAAIGDPPTSSTVNWSTNAQIIANSSTVGVDAGGVRLRAGGGSTDVVVDVTGYYIPAVRAPPGAGRFTAIAPSRAYDSRITDPLLSGGATRTSSVRAGGAVPVGAHAVAYNLTVAGTRGSGFLTAMAADAPSRPTASTINWYRTGQVIANGAVIGVDPEGAIAVFAGDGSTHYVVDVVGYFN